MAKAFPDIKVLTAENVPEDDNATRVMEDMIAKGAKIIFATSYGHLDPAMKVAADHPDVVVVQQGNFINGTIPPNVGTYFGTVYEPVYLAGIAAGKTTKTNKLGYVYAFPIPQTIANINAFELGAQSVNPAAQTIRGQHVELVRPGQAGRGGQEPPRPGRRRASPSTRTAPATDHQGRRGGRRHDRRLPRRRLGAGSQGLDHRLRVGLGRRCTPTS